MFLSPCEHCIFTSLLVCFVGEEERVEISNSSMIFVRIRRLPNKRPRRRVGDKYGAERKYV